MLRICSALRRRRQRARSGEGGFTLIEVVVATSILFIVMTSIAYLGTVAFADVAQARLRQTGTALANQALEQVRALRYDVVARGLHANDVTADPAIAFDGIAHRFGGERLAVHGGAISPAAPIVPHEGAQEIDDVGYTVRVYVTHYEDDLTSGAYRVTAIVSWSASIRVSAVNEAQAQTLIFSPSSSMASQSTATHPHPGPFQSYFYANANASPAGVQLLPVAAGIPILEGSTVTELSGSVPIDDVSLESESVVVVNAATTLSGSRVRHADGTTASSGYQRWNAQADSDGNPSSAPHYDAKPPPNGMSQAQATTDVAVSGSNSTSITLRSGAGDVGGAIAAVEANASYPCYNALGQAVSNVLPCGVARATQGSSTMATMDIPGHRLFTLLSVGPGSAASHVSRATTSVPACPTASGEGCVIAVKRQSTGAVGIGGLPLGFVELIPGFETVVKIDDYTTTVTAAAGHGVAAPTVTRSGTVTFWNATLGSYQILPLLAGTSRSLNCSEVAVGEPCIPVIDLTAPTTGIRIRVTSDLRIGGASTTACAANPCQLAEASAQSPIVGTITYEVTSGANPVARFAIHVDLGTLTANASYKRSA